MSGIGGINSLSESSSAQLKAFSTMPVVAVWNNHQISSQQPHHCTFNPKQPTVKVVDAAVEFSALKGLNEAPLTGYHDISVLGVEQLPTTEAGDNGGVHINTGILLARLPFKE